MRFVASLVVYVDGGRPLFVFIPNPKCNQNFNETISKALSMSKKALKMLLKISVNVNPAARLEVLILFAQVINKHLRMNTFINLESLTEMP